MSHESSVHPEETMAAPQKPERERKNRFGLPPSKKENASATLRSCCFASSFLAECRSGLLIAMIDMLESGPGCQKPQNKKKGRGPSVSANTNSPPSSVCRAYVGEERSWRRCQSVVGWGEHTIIFNECREKTKWQTTSWRWESVWAAQERWPYVIRSTPAQTSSRGLERVHELVHVHTLHSEGKIWGQLFIRHVIWCLHALMHVHIVCCVYQFRMEIVC